jgi:hypothetical protein
MENQRLVYAPIEDHRQATTRAALRGAIHVQSHNTTVSGQIQSRYISFEDVLNRNPIQKTGAPGGI